MSGGEGGRRGDLPAGITLRISIAYDHVAFRGNSFVQTLGKSGDVLFVKLNK